MAPSHTPVFHHDTNSNTSDHQTSPSQVRTTLAVGWNSKETYPHRSYYPAEANTKVYTPVASFPSWGSALQPPLDQGDTHHSLFGPLGFLGRLLSGSFLVRSRLPLFCTSLLVFGAIVCRVARLLQGLGFVASLGSFWSHLWQRIWILNVRIRFGFLVQGCTFLVVFSSAPLASSHSSTSLAPAYYT